MDRTVEHGSRLEELELDVLVLGACLVLARLSVPSRPLKQWNLVLGCFACSIPTHPSSLSFQSFFSSFLSFTIPSVPVPYLVLSLCGILYQFIFLRYPNTPSSHSIRVSCPYPTYTTRHPTRSYIISPLRLDLLHSVQSQCDTSMQD